MLYDIPGRTATPIATETLLRLGEHERIVAVKDAKGDIAETSRLTRDSGLAFYSGDDKNTLPFLAVGAVGVVGVPTHLFGRQTKEMILAFESGDHAGALRRHQDLLPVYLGFFRTQGVILTKAALREQRLPAGPVRSPLVDATEGELTQLRADCAQAGLELGAAR
jgi:4-hydroxy-tetrahydrodipicolinate synthase